MLNEDETKARLITPALRSSGSSEEHMRGERQGDRLTSESQALETQGAQSQLAISDEASEDALSKMRDGLIKGAIQTKRNLLGGFVDRIEANKERASVWHTFPLFARRGLHIMPPAEFESASPP
jgi:hypothetical protein